MRSATGMIAALALVCASGCSAAVDRAEREEGDGGGGNGGAGGTGGSVADDGCDACTRAQICVDGQACSERNLLSLGAQYDQFLDLRDPPGVDGTQDFISADGRRWTSTADTWTNNITATEGDCFVLKPNGEGSPYELSTWNVGTITASTSTIGTMEVMQNGPFAYWTPPPAGETFTWALSGGSDAAAMSEALEVPAIIDVTAADEVVRGQPVTVTWQAGDPGDFVEVTGYVYDTLDGIWLGCLTPDDGSLTIGGTLTAEIENVTATSFAITLRRHRSVVTHATNVAVVATVSTGKLVAVNYTP